MTRRELVERVRGGVGEELSEARIAAVIDRVFEEIKAAVRSDGRVSIPGFGTFTVRVQGARVGRNPRTGEVIEIAEGSTIAWKPSAEFKDSLGK